MIDKNLLIECPTADCDCPYWDWRYHKCAMMAQGEGDPSKECDNFWDYADESEWDSPEDFGETDKPEGW